jgi:hypothetical protein
MTCTFHLCDTEVSPCQLEVIYNRNMGCESPRWSEDLLGEIDPDKGRLGETIYRQACAGCHILIDRGAHTPVAGSGRTGTADITVTRVPLDQIGTDPRQALNFAARVVSLEKIGGPASIPYMDAAKAVAGGIVE